MFELANKKREQSSRKRQASATVKVARALATLAGAPNPPPATTSVRRRRAARASSRGRARARDRGTPAVAHTHGGGGAVVHGAAPCGPLLVVQADASGVGVPPAPAVRLQPAAGVVCSASTASSAWREVRACVPNAMGGGGGGDSSTTPLSTATPTPAAVVTGQWPHASLDDDAGGAVDVDASTVRSVVRNGRATVEPMDHVQGVESGKFRCRHCRVLVQCDGATLLRAVVSHLVACPRLPPFVKTQIKATPSPRTASSTGSSGSGSGRGGRSKRNHSSSSAASRAVSRPRPGQALGRVADLMLDTSFAANVAPAVRVASPATGQMALAGLLALGAAGAAGAASAHVVGCATEDVGNGTGYDAGGVVARDTKRQRTS